MTFPEHIPATLTETAALVVAHPGHELRVFGWMESAQPVVFVLTDGSGSGGETRIESTTALLDRMSARPGSVYGRMSDRDIYAAMLSHDFSCFTRLADELAAAFVAAGVDCVAGDSIEGYNPSHDVCRLVINTAVRIAARSCGATLAAYDFPLVEAPHLCPPELRDRARWVQLDDCALERKIQAARGYQELALEVERALEQFGVDVFRTECLRPVNDTAPYGWPFDRTPFYETYGEQRVAAGAYDKVVRFREHVVPLADALWSHGARCS